MQSKAPSIIAVLVALIVLLAINLGVSSLELQAERAVAEYDRTGTITPIEPPLAFSLLMFPIGIVAAVSSDGDVPVWAMLAQSVLWGIVALTVSRKFLGKTQ